MYSKSRNNESLVTFRLQNINHLEKNVFPIDKTFDFVQ